MGDSCCSQPSAGSETCEANPQSGPSRPETESGCPVCGQKGKPVPGQTVKALVSASLRLVLDADYFFCRTQTCPVVYYSTDGASVFTTSEIRERVYQKEPGSGDVFICYCFRHKAADLLKAGRETRDAIVQEINAGIQAQQCACDLRNPQGSCCLGNVRRLIQQTPARSAP
jgi:hypothetical protein